MEGGGRRDFFNGNLGNTSFPLIQPSPPFTAIDKFLWDQNNFSDCTSNPNVPSSFSSCFGANDGVFEGCFGQETGFLNEVFDQWNRDTDLDHLNTNNAVESAEESSVHVKSTRDKGGSSGAVKWIKGQWSEEEDRRLIKLVKQYGLRKWALIADKMEGRIGKQCRERWHNHLRPDIKKDIWCDEEEKLFIEAHQRIGNKWAEIAKSIPGRTENSIKNHWNATKRKQNSKRKLKKSIDQGLNGKTPSVLLEEYIKKIYVSNKGISSNIDGVAGNSPNTTNPDETSPPVGTSSTSNEDGDPTSYFTFETCDDEMNFMKSLFGNTGSRGSTTETGKSMISDNVNIPKNNETSLEVSRSLHTTVTSGAENLVENVAYSYNMDQIGDSMGIDQVHDMYSYPEVNFPSYMLEEPRRDIIQAWP